MSEIFNREYTILKEAQKHIDEVKSGIPFDILHFEALINEYSLLLEQQKQILEISDIAAMGLAKDRNTGQKKIIVLENELLQSRIAIMLSQIQPHFIFNSLNAIKSLCLVDPELASETVEEFSSYLRGNLDSLSIHELIPFKKELKHVKTYLSLEKKRFGDRLNIVYDINVDDFSVPVLTLQPIIENAVRHGITKKEEGGTVTLKTNKTETGIIITVIDDGIGYGSVIHTTAQNNERINIGIENVKNRLMAMCSGTLDISSTPGEGTTAVITIPFASKEDEINVSPLKRMKNTQRNSLL